MLDQRITVVAVAQVASSVFWLLYPSSRKTNFIWKLIEPIDPIEQMLPISNSQKGPLRNNSRKLCAGAEISGGGTARPSGCWPISPGLSFKRKIASGQVRNM